MSFNHLSRRHFLATTAGAAAAAALSRNKLAFAQDAVTDIPVSASKAGYEKVQWKVQPFPMTQVRLHDGPFLDARKTNLAFLNELPNDRLVHMFRVTAGIPSTAEPLGGWEAPDCELRGHFAGGHYLSAAALMYASTGDEAIRNKANELVTMLVVCQQPNGYLGAYPENFYDRLATFANTDKATHKRVWAPFYTYHKIMAGMLDMYVHTRNQEALTCAEKMADWAGAWITPWTPEQLAGIQVVEHGGMNEVMFNLYAVTGKQKYRDWGYHFEHKAFFDPLAAHEDKLNHLHANTNIPKAIGAARGYELTGDERYRSIADYFFHEVVGQHTYATGGTSNGEGWQAPGQLSRQLGPAAEECCCSYNMMKLGRHVHGWTADPRVMDYYERLLFNVRLGTQDPDGMLMYYVSLQPGLYKTFGKPYDALWCCTGTGVEEFSKTNDTIYSHDQKNIYVNQFIASEVHWSEKGFSLDQKTSFPEEEGTTLTVNPDKPTRLAINIRIPYWATKNVAIKVNGKLQHIDPTPSTYATLHRTWKKGDIIEVSLPMTLHTDPTPDDPTVQAMMYGPLVLAGRMGKDGLTENSIVGPSAPGHDGDAPMPMPDVQAPAGSATWVQPVPGSRLQFRTVGSPRQLDLSPLYQILDERYTVYFKVNQKTA